jgi:intein/homing endonuclease
MEDVMAGKLRATYTLDMVDANANRELRIHGAAVVYLHEIDKVGEIVLNAVVYDVTTTVLSNVRAYLEGHDGNR